MLAPSFTKMRDDIGRVTQKHPGSAENGSVYNHAAAFYIYALYTYQNVEHQSFIPNYYRGAYRQFERTAGRSSQLCNTGTVHWVYRCLVDGLFGVQGCVDGLKINPKLPSHWSEAKLQRRFRGAQFDISIERDSNLEATQIWLDGELHDGDVIFAPRKQQQYSVHVKLARV